MRCHISSLKLSGLSTKDDVNSVPIFFLSFSIFFPSARHCPAVLMVGSLNCYCALEVSPEQHDGKIASEFLCQMGPN